MVFVSGLHSKRSSIASIASLHSVKRKDSTSTTSSVTPETKLGVMVAHFSDPALVIPCDEAEAALDKGYLRGWAGGYGGGTGKKSPLTDEERFWLTKQCIERFLDATKGDIQHTIQRLTDTLIWRRSYGLEALFDDPEVQEEHARGRHFYHGYDAAGHLVHYIVPSGIESKGGEQQIKHAVWFAELAPAFFKPGHGAVTLLVDFTVSTSKKPSVATARQSIHIMQNHYPNRLHRAYFRNLSPIMSTFVSLTTPFMDPKTAAKLHIDRDPLEEGAIDADNLVRDWGGNNDFTARHPDYYNELKETYNRVMPERLDRWRRLGGVVGEDEHNFFDGEVQSG